MAEKKFSKEQALRFGWDRMKNNLGFFIVYLIILFIVEWFFSMFAQLFLDRLPSLSLLFYLGYFVVILGRTIFCRSPPNYFLSSYLVISCTYCL